MIAADEVDKWSRLCEGLQTEWECTTVNLDAFEKFHTIAVYDAVLIRYTGRHFLLVIMLMMQLHWQKNLKK